MAHITGKLFTLADLKDREWALATSDTANIGGTQFVYLSNNGTSSSGIKTFSIAADGSLTYLANTRSNSENALDGAWEMETFTIGETTFLAAVGQGADGLSVFALRDTAPYLEHVDSVFDGDNPLYELNGARYLSVHQIEGNTYLVATSRNFFRGDGTFDNGITVFKVANDGTLTFASAFDNTSGTSIANGWPSDTFEFGGNYYFALGEPFAPRFSIMQIDPDDGALTVAVPNAAQFQPNFFSTQIAVQMVNGIPYLFVPSDSDDKLYVYTYQGGSDVIAVTSIDLEATVGSFTAEVATTYQAGDDVIVAVGGSGGSHGVLLFNFDTSAETLTEIQWLPGSTSSEPNAQLLKDMSFGTSFMIDGIPYALITSDDDHTLNVFAIGGGDDVLDGTMEADLIEGYGGNDTMAGLAGDDTLIGGDGNDDMHGNRGNDDLSGGDGDDTMRGGAGDDTLNGDAGADVILGFSGNDQMFGGADNDVLKGGQDADVIEGGDGDDEIVGGSGDDTLSGQDGNDFINAGGGMDIVTGDAGNDLLFGGAGNDDLSGGTGEDLLKGNDGHDTLSGGADNDVLSGQIGDDTLNGDAGDDTLQGGAGRDRLNGGAGDDVLTGGSAMDVFVFDTIAAGGGGTDTVTDFTDGVDQLDLISYGYATAGDALSGAVQDNSHVRLTLSDGQVVVIENLLTTDLDGADLILI